MTRYRVLAALTSLVLTFSLPAPSPGPPRCRQIYSARATRRMRNLFRIQVYEWKVRQLERAEAAVRHRVSVSQLLDPDVALLPTISRGGKASKLKQSTALGATTCL